MKARKNRSMLDWYAREHRKQEIRDWMKAFGQTKLNLKQLRRLWKSIAYCQPISRTKIIKGKGEAK